ncbi:hypothetical protein FRB99_004154 [Tulasnella sp. 403]|nr:hypothetical protein FRB99_004154 [Tulasnella sp. 403]
MVVFVSGRLTLSNCHIEHTSHGQHHLYDSTVRPSSANLSFTIQIQVVNPQGNLLPEGTTVDLRGEAEFWDSTANYDIVIKPFARTGLTALNSNNGPEYLELNCTGTARKVMVDDVSEWNLYINILKKRGQPLWTIGCDISSFSASFRARMTKATSRNESVMVHFSGLFKDRSTAGDLIAELICVDPDAIVELSPHGVMHTNRPEAIHPALSVIPTPAPPSPAPLPPAPPIPVGSSALDPVKSSPVHLQGAHIARAGLKRKSGDDEEEGRTTRRSKRSRA